MTPIIFVIFGSIIRLTAETEKIIFGPARRTESTMTRVLDLNQAMVDTLKRHAPRISEGLHFSLDPELFQKAPWIPPTPSSIRLRSSE